MQDLQETSNHSVDILKHFVVNLISTNLLNLILCCLSYLIQPELCRIIQDPDPSCCKLAHNLLLRHLKQAPRYLQHSANLPWCNESWLILFVYIMCSAVDELLPSFIGCLESHDHSVVSAAITSIPDLVLLCKGILIMHIYHS